MQKLTPVIFESEPELALDTVRLLRQILHPKELILQLKILRRILRRLRTL